MNATCKPQDTWVKRWDDLTEVEKIVVRETTRSEVRIDLYKEALENKLKEKIYRADSYEKVLVQIYDMDVSTDVDTLEPDPEEFKEAFDRLVNHEVDNRLQFRYVGYGEVRK